MKDRLKEISRQIWEKSEQIKMLKKEIITLHQEADMIYGYKKIERKEEKNKKRL